MLLLIWEVHATEELQGETGEIWAFMVVMRTAREADIIGDSDTSTLRSEQRVKDVA